MKEGCKKKYQTDGSLTLFVDNKEIETKYFCNLKARNEYFKKMQAYGKGKNAYIILKIN